MLIIFASQDAIKSLISEAIAKKLSRLALLNVNIMSFSLERIHKVPEVVYDVLREKGYPTENLKVRTIEEVPYSKADILITLSLLARDKCPYIKEHKRREHWNIDEVTSIDLPTLRRIRDQIEDNIEKLFRLKK